MGYYASGAGKFTFDMSKVTDEQIDEILNEDIYGVNASECGCEIETADFGTGAKDNEFYVTFPYASYHEELWYDFLRSMNGLLEEGEIEFDGDDDMHWRFHYRNGKWYEDDGYIAYKDGFEI